MSTDSKLPVPSIELSPEERALLNNDLSKLSPTQRADLVVKVCQSLGLNPLTQPFQYIQLNGKLTLYAQRNCTDQLRAIQSVSLTIQDRKKEGDLFIVTARATLPSGRQDESVGAVTLSGLKNEALANAIMKCETKAKRRVTLSICGLSFMDETEVETIKDAKPVVEKLPPPAQEFPPEEFQAHEYFEEPPFDPEEPSEDECANFILPFGKWKGKKLRAIRPSEVRGWINWLKDSAKEKNKPIQGVVAEVIYYANEYVRLFGSNEGG